MVISFLIFILISFSPRRGAHCPAPLYTSYLASPRPLRGVYRNISPRRLSTFLSRQPLADCLLADPWQITAGKGKKEKLPKTAAPIMDFFF
jgi:hypothetical protein